MAWGILNLAEISRCGAGRAGLDSDECKDVLEDRSWDRDEDERQMCWNI